MLNNKGHIGERKLIVLLVLTEWTVSTWRIYILILLSMESLCNVLLFPRFALGPQIDGKNSVHIWQYEPKKSTNKRCIITAYFHFVFIFIFIFCCIFSLPSFVSHSYYTIDPSCLKAAGQLRYYSGLTTKRA